MTHYMVRAFNPTDEEYAAIVHVYNQAKPHQPGSAASWSHWDKHRDPTRLFRRYVVEKETEIVGYGFAMGYAARFLVIGCKQWMAQVKNTILSTHSNLLST